MRCRYCAPVLAVAVLAADICQTAAAAEAEKAKADGSLLSLERIYVKREFEPQRFSARWLPDGSGYLKLERSRTGGRDIVRYDPETGERRILVPAGHLVPPGRSAPLSIEGYAFSKDMSLLLVYTNSKRVWRRKTRGDYWVLDRSSRQLHKLGGDAKPATLMFAKLSPTGPYAAYVRDRNIFLEDLRDHAIRQLTTADAEEVINGTFDWVYEEEFRLRDGFRWSPDGNHIAYWQLDTSGEPMFPLVNNTDSLYPQIRWFRYPKVGQRNAFCRIGVVDIANGKTQWLSIPGDPRDHYIARMDWVDSSHIVLQQLNRRQNTNRVMIVEAGSGKPKVILTERDEAWVDVNDELKWFSDKERFTWISERDGWRHVYIVSWSKGEVKLVTPGDFDCVRLLLVDEKRGFIYFIASPSNPTQRYLYRVRLDGTGVQRVTPLDQPGTHSYQISPDGRWAFHTLSRFDNPPQTELVRLPEHEVVRPLVKNEKLAAKLGKLKREPTEFFRVDIGGGVSLDAWCMKPPGLQADKKYPLLVYVYGEPAGQTVLDRWGGSNYLWHLMLAQQGYVVMSFDNRGTPAPRGRAWRKCVYRQIGILAPQDQAAAVRAVIKQRAYLDPKRIGIWGWSGGGSMTLNAIFKYPDLYQTAIAVAPVANMRYYDTIYQERYMGLPGDNVEGYLKGSPINFAHQLKGNLLIIHGTGDDNCHYQTTEMLINELIKHNKRFTMMAYPNRTHAIREGRNTTLHLRGLMTWYLHQNLPPGPAKR